MESGPRPRLRRRERKRWRCAPRRSFCRWSRSRCRRRRCQPYRNRLGSQGKRGHSQATKRRSARRLRSRDFSWRPLLAPPPQNISACTQSCSQDALPRITTRAPAIELRHLLHRAPRSRWKAQALSDAGHAPGDSDFAAMRRNRLFVIANRIEGAFRMLRCDELCETSCVWQEVSEHLAYGCATIFNSEIHLPRAVDGQSKMPKIAHDDTAYYQRLA
jgi:hypothetical protein